MTYNTSMSTLPVPCQSCGYENMVDMDSLEKQPVDKVVSKLGFVCKSCDNWVTVSYRTRMLDDALKKLESKSPQSANYHFHFARTLKKSEGVQEKYGGF